MFAADTVIYLIPEEATMDNPMMQAMQQLQLMQEKMAEAQGQLESMSVSEVGGGGMIRVTVNGNGRITRVDITPEAYAGDDREMFEDLLIATINKTLDSAKAMAEQHVAKATEGLMPNIPGFDLPF